MKIAVIGSGISGMTAAYLLSEDHEVVLFESNDYIGGHTNTADVTLNGRQYPVDTGFIVFNEKTYPNFVKLMNRLGGQFFSRTAFPDDEPGRIAGGKRLNGSVH